MNIDAGGMTREQMIQRALQEDRAAAKATDDVARLAHEGLAVRLRQAAADLHAEKRNTA